MKSALFTFILLSFSFTYAQGSSNPWDLEKLSVDQIIELENIDFEMDKAELNDDSKEALNSLKKFLLENKTVVLELRGHTNNVPDGVYCDKLSTQRAQAVREYLIEEGVSPQSIVAKGYGKKLPIASNEYAEGRAANQRVDVKIMSL